MSIPPQEKTGRLLWAVLLTAVLIYAAQAVYTSTFKSAAFDEQYHLTAGYTYLQTGDFRLADSHPPLAGTLAALPLSLTTADMTLNLEHDAWRSGNRFLLADVFMWQSGNDAHAMLVPARCMITAVGGLMLIGLFFWSRRLSFGWVAPVIVLGLAAFDPNLVTHGRLVTTDLPLTAFTLLAMWQLYLYLTTRNFVSLLTTGLFVGAAIATKYTGLLLLPIAAVCVLIHPHPDRRRMMQALLIPAVALLTLWAVLGFSSDPWPTAAYWQNLWETFTKLPDESQQKLSFLLGRTTTGGWWYYFPVALLVKTPLLTLISAGFGLSRLRSITAVRETVTLWLPPLAFLLVGLSGVLTIGYRHILPAVPFLILLAAYGGDGLFAHLRTVSFGPTSAATAVLAFILLGHIIDVSRVFPHQEAYFSPLIGRPENGSRILVDSNLDWGQDLILLRDWQNENQVDFVNLAYFGMAYPEQYGVRYRPLPGYLRFVTGPEVSAYNPIAPRPGWYAISATTLRTGTLSPETADLYAFFQDREPYGRIGYSINLYYVDYPAHTRREPVPVTGQPAYQRLNDRPPDAPPPQVKWTADEQTTIYPVGEPAVQPAVRFTETVNFGGAFILTGYTADIAAPGRPFTLTVHWQAADTPIPRPSPAAGPPLAAFFHLVREDTGGRIAQYDGWGTALRGLVPGDQIAQTIVLDIPADASPGRYGLQIGLYSPQDGRRFQLQPPVPVTAAIDTAVIPVRVTRP